MKLRYAVIISAAVHIVLFLVILIGAGFFSFGKGVGPGSAITAWLSAPVGGMGAAKKAKGTPKQMERGRENEMTAKIETKPKEEEKGTEEETLKGSQTPGVGGGPAEGGIGMPGGLGGSGDPTLAAIWRRIDASKYYPPSARHRGLTGMPKVTFAIGKDGKVLWVKLANSCGQTILDNAALSTVKRAEPLPYYPKPVTIAVKFSLDD